MMSVIDYRKKIRKLRKYHLLLCLVGLMVSLYTVYVEVNLEKDPKYTALCDISPGISCTVVFGSEWGKGFGFVGKLVGDNSTLNQPNGFYGVVSYPVFVITSRIEYMFFAKITLLIGVIGVVLSGYLGYILYLLNDICVVCIGIYVVNFFLLITSVLYYRSLKSLIGLQTIASYSTAPKPESKKRV